MTNLLDDLVSIRDLLENNDLLGARALCADVLSRDPGNDEVLEVLGVVSNAIALETAEIKFSGPKYREWLMYFHKLIKPQAYVEIGVANGGALGLALPPTKAIGIDPQFSLVTEMSTWTKVYKIESDEFFLSYNLDDVMGKSKLDFAFIDGLHTFDQALKDFINLEKSSHKKTVIAFHDIYPVEPITANRQRLTTFWLGDTWKVIPILRRYRPDLNVFTIPTYPSGLGVVSGLDPSSKILEENFDDIVEFYMSELDSDILSPEIHLNVKENDFQLVAKLIEK